MDESEGEGEGFALILLSGGASSRAEAPSPTNRPGWQFNMVKKPPKNMPKKLLKSLNV